MNQRLERARKEKEEYLVQKEELEQSIASLQSSQQAMEKAALELSEQIGILEDKIVENNKKKITFLNDNTNVVSEQQRMKTLLEQNNLEKAKLTKRILENKSEAAVLTETLEKEKSVYDDVTKKLTEMDNIYQEHQRQQEHLDREMDNLRREHRDTQQRYHMEHSRLESLRNLTERYDGFGQSIKRVMEQKKQYPGIIGVVADIIRVQKEYELAIETALGGSIQNIVTDNEQTAKAMIAHLKKNKYGRATFLPLTNMRAKPVNLSGNLMQSRV